MKTNLLVCLFVIVIFGCTKKNADKPSTTNNIDITGSWTVGADTLRMYQNGVLKEMDAFTGNTIQLFNFQFKSNGTVVFTSQSDPTQKDSATYSVNNNIITFFHPAEIINGTSEIAYSQNATIKQHTSNSLVIFFDDSSTSGSTTAEDTEIVYMTK